jgi:secreted trypsin-like serine protease
MASHLPVITTVLVLLLNITAAAGPHAVCGKPAIKPNLNARIVGGEEAVPHSWPWICLVQTMVEFMNTGQSFMKVKTCGASVINENYLLTAAHCAFDEKKIFPASAYTITCGLHNRTGSDGHEQRRLVRRVIVHSLYNPKTYVNDIAILRLNIPLKFNDYVTPVCLAQRDVAEYTNCAVAGWGQTKDTGDRSVLQQLVLPVLPMSYCKKAYSMLTDNQFCAGMTAGGKDSCAGDSGGPLICKTQQDTIELQGVVSYGKGCALAGSPGVYTRVTHYLSWINLMIGGH